MPEQLQQWLFDPTIGKLVTAAVGMIGVFTIAKLLQRSINRYVADTDNRYRARKFVAFFGYVAAFVVVAGIFSDRLTGLTVTFGVAGAGIAFALQEAIASVAGWVALSFGAFYRSGDRIQLGGIRGDVIDIGVLRTTVMEVGEWVKGDLYNGRIVRIANSFVFKEPVFNYSADFPFLWDELVLPIRYGSDRRLVREILERVSTQVVGDYANQSKEAWKQVVAKYLIENAQVDPMITMTMDENWMEFTLRYVVDYKKRRKTKDLLFTRILDEVDATENRVRIATAAFEISSDPTLDVTLRDHR